VNVGVVVAVAAAAAAQGEEEDDDEMKAGRTEGEGSEKRGWSCFSWAD